MLPKVIEDEIVLAQNGDQFAGVGLTTHNQAKHCGFRHQWQDDQKREWSTEICGVHSGTSFQVAVHLHCSTSNIGIPLPTPSKPYIVKQILEEFGGDIDGEFVLGREPRVLAENEIDLAKRILQGQASHQLPVVYSSSTWQNSPSFDVEHAAKQWSGMAHVVVEPNRRFSFVLADKIKRQNPYEGAVAICWPPGTGKPVRLFPYHFPSPHAFFNAIGDVLREAMTSRRPDYRCTWDYLRELIVRRRIFKLRNDGKTQLDEYAAAFDEELKLAKNRLEVAEKENARLKVELANKTREARHNADGLLKPSDEEDLFAGEQRDILVHALEVAHNNSQPGGRIQDVLASLIKANPPTGESKRIEESIREVLSSCKNIGTKEWRALEELGFSITEDGKHLKLVFRSDDRYTFAMAKSGSDHRGMKNWISDVTKRLFK